MDSNGALLLQISEKGVIFFPPSYFKFPIISLGVAISTIRCKRVTFVSESMGTVIKCAK